MLDLVHPTQHCPLRMAEDLVPSQRLKALKILAYVSLPPNLFETYWSRVAILYFICEYAVMNPW